MKLALPPFSKHYASYTFYVIYILMWFLMWLMIPQLKHELDGGLIPLFGMFTAIAFIIIGILNAIFRIKDQRKFYLWLILFIILPPAAVIIVN
jgi:uncharacterized membrane protein (GlpM family)